MCTLSRTSKALEQLQSSRQLHPCIAGLARFEQLVPRLWPLIQQCSATLHCRSCIEHMSQCLWGSFTAPIRQLHAPSATLPTGRQLSPSSVQAAAQTAC